jgi:hypothetical protein
MTAHPSQRIHPTFWIFPIALVAWFTLATPSHGNNNNGIEHQRILWIADPSTEAVISWTTREAGESHQVYYDTVARNGNLAAYAQQATSFKDGMFTMLKEDEKWVKPGYYHHVRLTELKPATVYHFVIVSDGKASREYHFVTAPAEDLEFAMLFGGDSRVGGKTPVEHNERRKMNERMSSLLKANPRILGLIHGGDYCETAHWRFLDAWLSDHERVITDQGRMLPIIPVRGNHDMQVGFEEAFPLPEGANNYYYSVSLSSEVAVVVLNTEISLGGSQRNWLASELEKLRPENRWLITAYHRPAYPSVRSPQDGAARRTHWVPLFEEFNIDLACESHDHALKRTLPIRNGEPDHENGILYIGDGGLGVPQRKPDPTRWWFGAEGFTKPVHHVHMFEFGKEVFRGRAFGMDGDTLDDFRIHPRAKSAK